MRLQVAARVDRPAGFRLDATLDVTAEAIAIVGPSGSGKTTLLEAIAGIESGATVVLDGRDLSALPVERRDVGYVMQESLLFPHLSVRANLLFGVRAADPEPVAATLGIDHLLDRMPRNLSGGERRRVALARAIVNRPRLLLLDEPFAGLDAPRRREAASLLDHARRRFGVPIVLVSHLADEVLSIADCTVRIEAGRVVASGPSASVVRGGEIGELDNLLSGVVVGPGRVRVEGVELHAAIPASATGGARLACYAHEIVLARDVPRAISARNRLDARVAALEPAGDAVIVTIDRPRLRAIITPEALHELDLAVGTPVVALVKALSMVYLGGT